MTATTTAPSLMDLLRIAQYIDAHPFITERQLLDAGYRLDDLLRTANQTNVTRNYRPYGRTFYLAS
jgi:hypothetical protein